jgi:hypothetical protein
MGKARTFLLSSPYATYHLPSTCGASGAACVQQIYGQAERAIRTGKLNTLPHLHLPPMYVVVFDGPSEESHPE